MRPYCPLRCLFALFYVFCGSVWCSEARIQFQNRFPPFPPFQALSLPLLHILLNNFFFYYSINRRIWRIFFIKKKKTVSVHIAPMNALASIFSEGGGKKAVSRPWSREMFSLRELFLMTFHLIWPVLFLHLRALVSWVTLKSRRQFSYQKHAAYSSAFCAAHQDFSLPFDF